MIQIVLLKQNKNSKSASKCINEMIHTLFGLRTAAVKSSFTQLVAIIYLM